MKEINIGQVRILQFENISETDCFHFISTIDGGVSNGNYKSLNLGSNTGDTKENIDKNWRIFSSALCHPLPKFYTPWQLHENKISIINEDFLSLSATEQDAKLYGHDAIISNIPQIAIFVETADCVPILLYDKRKKVLASIHAGWRGTVGEIVKLTVEKMDEVYSSHPKDILAGIGPSISAKSFEVGEELGQAFLKIGYKLESISYRNTETNKLHINLWEANKLQLIDAGIAEQNIEIAGLCTFDNIDDFFSARRQTIKSGRIITGGYIL